MRSDRKRLLDKLLRELERSEGQAIVSAARETRRLGNSPPTQALRAVAAHAVELRPRFSQVLDGHDLAAGRTSLGSRLATFRHLITDRVHDAERSYRAVLLDERHGIDVVRVLREVAHLEGLFALIRWCDDWLGARRTLVARVEAQLSWFAEHPRVPPPPPPSTQPSEPRADAGGSSDDPTGAPAISDHP